MGKRSQVKQKTKNILRERSVGEKDRDSTSQSGADRLPSKATAGGLRL